MAAPLLLLAALVWSSTGFTSVRTVARYSPDRQHTKLSSTRIPSTTTSADPVLTDLLLRAATGDEGHRFSLSNVTEASEGLAVWSGVLCRGRLPVLSDFATEGVGVVWPGEPLFSRLVRVMAEMQLPRFVLRHPETVSAVLLSVLRAAIDFHQGSLGGSQEQNDPEENDDDDEDDGDMIQEEIILDSMTPDSLELLAEDLVGELVSEWGGVIGGVQALDQLFGAEHGLLDVRQNDHTAPKGFGVDDGVWQHSGWSELPSLQRRLASMPQLRDLMKSLGRRSKAEGTDGMRKFAPRMAHPHGVEGARFDPTAPTSVNGLTLSGSLSRMLPSEALLLRGSSPVLRRLFLAKKVERKLLSYELSGWTDTPSVPTPKTNRSQRMPSAPGGPLIVCLDTSWSMSGMRERLSKAVVLACVSAAHKQGRECRVVAFSAGSGVMESGALTPDVQGVNRLLEFLKHSFGGGTDVTGALKHAMKTMEGGDMEAADLLLLTDGEIPDPPVEKSVMEDLDRLKQRSGMQIHGLLVGRTESHVLEKICTHTHDFLVRYEHMLLDTEATGDWRN